MPDDPQQDQPADTPEVETPEVEARRREAGRRRRRRAVDEVFGDVLPDTTSDEQGGRGRRDDEILRDVPPHHG